MPAKKVVDETVVSNDVEPKVEEAVEASIENDLVDFDSAYEERKRLKQQSIMTTIMKPFPKNAIKQRQGGGGKMLDYIEGQTAIRRLIEATNGEYDIRITDRWREEIDEDNIFLYMAVEVDIPTLGTTAGVGVATIKMRGRSGGEDIVKGALIDGVKNALKNRGMALQLYGEDYEAPAPPPAAPTPRVVLHRLLKEQGVTDIPAIVKDKFNLDNPKDMTDAQVAAWIKELQPQSEKVLF